MTRPAGGGEPAGPFRPLGEGTFNFACHPGLACFTRCCADLNLALTPYDILRLKARLKLSSEEFLELYTEACPPEGGRFPRVRLKMASTPGRPCPFVTPEGCRVYEDRPGACRIYPLGRGSARGGREFFFVVEEEHCQGFAAKKAWTAPEWLADQGLSAYNPVNDLWMEILTSKASLGPPEHHLRKMQMFFMVSYNLDRFRDFVFESRFLDLFALEPQHLAQVRTDDLALLKLGFRWLGFSLFGQKSLPLRK